MYALIQHKTLDFSKWTRFDTSQQLLMIGNELNRAINLSKQSDNQEKIVNCLERAFELTDLTINSHIGHFQHELLRWRDLLASLYIEKNWTEKELSQLLKSLLMLNAAAYITIAN